MTGKDIESFTSEYLKTSDLNSVAAEDAIYPDLAGMQIYGGSLVGFAAADDKLFAEDLKKEDIVHPDYMAPKEWMEDAKTVVSFFLPFTELVCESNKKEYDIPYDPRITSQRCSAEWLHARIEGQKLVIDLMIKLCEFIKVQGCKAVAPTLSPQFRLITPYISNWSERHAAYVAGLGTFGLSKGLITERGMAGRFGSVITDAELTPTIRPYSTPFEYCIMCGECQRRCPANAIDVNRGCAKGKDQNICGPYVEESTLPKHGPNRIIRYGCGKCQVAVPCEHRKPYIF